MNTSRGWVNKEWVQRGLNALGEMLDVDGALKRDMIEFLFETGLWDSTKLTHEAAIAKWNANLNPSTNAFFKIGEVWALSKRFERFHLLHAMAEDCGFDLRRQPTEERRQHALEQLVEELKRSNDIAQHAHTLLSQLDTGGAPLRIHPAVQEGGSFSLPDGSSTGAQQSTF